MSVFRQDALAGKVAFVTGGGSGICRGITEAFMRHGADAAILGRKADRLEQTARELSEATGRRCLPVAGDVREPEAVEAAIDRTLAELGGLDVVVNGAAGNFLSPAAALSYKGFRTVLEIDTLGTYNVSKAAFTKALSRNGGSIINISATLHYTGMPLQVHAGSAKAANDAMIRHLAVEWGAAGIRVNAIAPGPIGDTEGMRRLAPGGFADKLAKSVPLRRLGEILDIANAALFLASDAASYVTGAVLVVDGGSWLTAGGLNPMG